MKAYLREGSGEMVSKEVDWCLEDYKGGKQHIFAPRNLPLDHKSLDSWAGNEMQGICCNYRETYAAALASTCLECHGLSGVRGRSI